MDLKVHIFKNKNTVYKTLGCVLNVETVVCNLTDTIFFKNMLDFYNIQATRHLFGFRLCFV